MSLTICKENGVFRMLVFFLFVFVVVVFSYKDLRVHGTQLCPIVIYRSLTAQRDLRDPWYWRGVEEETRQVRLQTTHCSFSQSNSVVIWSTHPLTPLSNYSTSNDLVPTYKSE